ncbi:acyl-CoA dehydrogenase family protein [Aquicella lusitana]|uniref:Butyryl-CoA dehydrogenase n=1 Tax=Aquicella lusitana TaxID=254246 RepID=A0A370GMX1_9COXI|nr:acyl-CoA dehydrogenase family protein [Aquicella lusitana]RDI43774.1 butyryl-CoA dehydrogenase [Aquicella lusitana]VVC74495.1 Acyl-CoA dehydrogenase [Aquicella lusitana]
MDFSLTHEQSAIREMARNFAEKEMAPFANEWDEKYIFPVDTLRKAASLGLAAIYVRSDVGGTELNRLDSAIIFEELATACPSTAAYLSIHNMVGWLIDQYADESLRQTWLPKLATMEVMSSYCLTEPGSGSDAASLKTLAVRDNDHYVLNGAKAFISGGSTSDIYVCMVRTGGEGPHGISCLLVEKDRPGISFGKREQKLGWHSQPTTMVFFENCRVPVSNRIGEEGQGFKIALSALNGGRINIAACSLGGAKNCLELARQYMLERTQFKQKLAEFEALQFTFADMLTHLEASRMMVYRAAFALDEKDPHAIMYCAMAKRLATDLCFTICDQALQLHGGYGYIRDYPIERYFRDLRVHQILEGTNEIMRLIIARQAFQETFKLC